MLNRFDPALPVGAYKTFSVRAPISTHTRVATCTEVGCAAQEHGWVTYVDEGTELGQKQAHYIRHVSKRHYREGTLAELTSFGFPPGQSCFQQHRVSLERPEVFRVRPGDWRITPARHEIYTHHSAEDWLDEFATNQSKLADLVNRG